MLSETLARVRRPAVAGPGDRLRRTLHEVDARADALAQSTFLAALDLALDEPVRFRIDGTDTEIVVGPASAEGTVGCTVRIAPRVFAEILSYGNLGLGEAFMRGDFAMLEGRLDDLLTVLLRCRVDHRLRRTQRLAVRAALIQLRNVARSRQDLIRGHYDTGNDLFEAFLDRTLTYTCGYQLSPDDSLDQLQLNKLDRICRKLRLREGLHLLDLGCGFGGLLMFAAEHYGTTGVGVTLSAAQQEWATAELTRRGLRGRVEIRVDDYRNLRAGTFDRVVSVGLLEHVPPGEYPGFCRQVAGSLGPGGLALTHAISTTNPKSRHDPFIQRYVWPGSHQVRLSALVAAMEDSGLAVIDVESIGRHYVPTALAWLENFKANRASLDRKRYDAVFCRMWEYWLSCCVAAARWSEATVHQVLVHGGRSPDVPLHRI